MNNKVIKIISIIVCSIVLIIGGIYLYNYLRVKYAKVEVNLVDDLTLEFNSKKKVSDYIESINGKIIDDYTISSTKLGEKEVKFKFINNDNIKLTYTYNIEVVDTVKPVVWVGSSYTVVKGSNINLREKIMCGDNYDANPICEIIGEYDLNTVGSYPLTYKASDSSGNINNWEFTLNVIEGQTGSNNTVKSSTNYSDVVNNYKTSDTKIGIDVSEWQGEIDFEKLKSAGVEFIMIRVGYQKGIDGEYVIDPYFEKNITGANKAGIDAGIYFYSYANSSDEAKKQAKWVVKQIKKYDIALPVAFDWEEWNSYNEFHLSFFGLTNMADEFIKEVEKNGYDGMLYSSKSYLESIWLDNSFNIWLAHYTDNTDYTGTYKIWQLCQDGKISGIDADVDIDILYK